MLIVRYINRYLNSNKYPTYRTKPIKIIQIQAGGNNKPRSPKFISFFLLIDKFSYFK